MTEEDRYLNNAIAALELAQRAPSRDAEARLLKLADAWRDLAECARRDAGRPREPAKPQRPLRRGPGDVNRSAMLVEIGLQLRTAYTAVEQAAPERLSDLVRQIDRLAA